MINYTIQPGDTLTKIGQKFGIDWRDIMSANKNSITDPNKIYSGKNIVVPDKVVASGGSLDKTLPSLNADQKMIGNAPAASDKTLPSQNPGSEPVTSGLPSSGLDQLSALKIALRNASDIATKSGIKTGLQNTFGAMGNQGISPEKVSGNLVGGIIDFVENNVKTPIESQFNNMSDIVDNITKKQDQIKNEAQSQITQSISSGMWNQLEDTQREALWTAAGYVGKPPMVKDDNIAFYHTEDNQGNVWNVGYDKTTGAITKKENLGPIGKATTDPGEKPATLQDATKAMASKLATRVGADGKISPMDYATAKAAWVAESGFTGKEFDAAMSSFRNLQNPDYQLDPEYKG